MAPTRLGMGHLPKPAKSVSLERDFRSQTKIRAWPVGPGTTRMARREATCHKKWLREAPSSSLSGSLCLATLQEAWVSRFGGSANLHTPEAQAFFPAGAHTPACLLSSLGPTLAPRGLPGAHALSSCPRPPQLCSAAAPFLCGRHPKLNVGTPVRCHLFVPQFPHMFSQGGGLDHTS